MMRSWAFWRFTLSLALCATTWPLSSVAEQLKGTNFINVMGRNTLVGTAADGAKFRVYFLPGGIVTYQDNRHKNDHGTWMLDQNGDVCVTWASLLAGRQNCYQVTVDKAHVTWSNKDMANQGGLVGGVASMDAKPLD